MNNPKPKIYNNDIKVLGRVVSITSENKVAAAEQIFDEKFKYNELPDYSFDNENIDPTRKGLNQYSINRLIGKKVKDIEDAGLLPDEDGFLNNIKIDNLTVKNGATFSGDVSFGDNVSIDKNLTVGNKITTKDLEVTNNARINKLVVGPGEGIDVYDALTHLLQCCENMNNQGGSGQGGITLVVSPNPINMNVGDTVEFTVKLNVGGMDLVIDPEINYTASISDTSVATLIGNNKVKAVSGGTTQLTVSWNGIQKTVQINVTQPLLTFRVTFYPNNGQDNFYQDVQEGNKLVAVTNPTKTGYTFNGWHKDTESGIVWNFNNVVTSNMSLVAGYTQNEQPVEPTYWTVTYNPNIDDDTILASTETVEDGYTASGRTLSKDGYTFNGWTLNGSAYNFNTPVHSNITLVGSWTQNEPEQPETHTYQLTLDPTSMNMTVGGETRGIIATRKRDNDVVISDGTINWSSSDTSIATVDQAGTVTVHGQGNATITATWVDPNGETKTATCSVTASVNIVQPTSLKIVGHENVTVDESTKVATVDVTDGSKTVKFKAVITPSNADTDTEITWTKLDGVGEIIPDPNDSSICTYVSLDRSSVCNLKATTANGMSDQILINVVAPEPQGEITYGVTLNKNSETITSGGDGFTLSATLKEFTNGVNTNIIPKAGLTITWTSSNTTAATVNNDGVVTPVDNLTEGDVTNIVVHWIDPNGEEKTDTCEVTVNRKPAADEYVLTAFPQTINLTKGGDPERVVLTVLKNNSSDGISERVLFSPDINYHSHGSDNPTNPGVSISPAADVNAPTGVPVTFYAIVASAAEVLAATGHAWDQLTVLDYNNTTLPKASVTVTAITNAEPTPNEHYAIFFDPNLSEDEEDLYGTAEHPQMNYYPNAYELGRTTFYAGSRQQDMEFITEATAKQAASANGVDRDGYNLRWDVGLYDTMPDRNIYVKAIWSAKQFTLTYKDGDTTVDTQSYYTGNIITPTTVTGYTGIAWKDMPTNMRMPGHDLIVYATFPFTVDPTELPMIAGEHTHQLTAKINGTATQNVTWSSSDSSIASVDETGLVTALAKGDAIITATTTDNRAANSTATCSITVTVRNPRLRHSGGQNASPALSVGESVDFIEEVLDGPEGCRLVWSSDSSVCEVSVKEQYLTRDGTETITIKAIGEGVATITAALVDSEGNAVMAKNSSDESYPVHSDVINVTVFPDPIMTIEWETDEHANLSNTSSLNGVAEFEPITLDGNGDAEYHDWTADLNIDPGYKVKNVTVETFHGVSLLGVPDYRTYYGNKEITDNSITLDATGLAHSDRNTIKITVTTEEV